jgi:hypothetical protein
MHSNYFKHAGMKFYFFSEFGGGICGEAVPEVRTDASSDFGGSWWLAIMN